MNATNPPILHIASWSTDIMDQLVRELPLAQRPIRMFGREILQPRLTALVGEGAYTYSGRRMDPAPWGVALSALRSKLEVVTGTRFQVCLANLYRDGSDSIAWHADDEKDLDHASPIASVSFGSARTFKMRHADGSKAQVELGGGDLLVMGAGMQQAWQHSVPKATNVGPRLSLTFRSLAK